MKGEKKEEDKDCGKEGQRNNVADTSNERLSSVFL